MLVSDGISSILSDEEVVDLTRGTMDPKIAAERIISFSQDLGGDDNATAIVVPLAGWGKVTGPDKTKDLREYRWRQASECSCSDSFQFIDDCKQLGQRDNDVCNISYTSVLYHVRSAVKHVHLLGDQTLQPIRTCRTHR